MAAFHSCLEILFRPESPEVSLCSLSRAAPSSPSPALAPGTSLPVRRGGGHGGGGAALFGPRVPGGWLGCPLRPGPLRQHTGTGAAVPRQQEQRVSTTLSKKKETLESLHKTVAFVAGPAL